MITARPLTARRIIAERIRGLLLGDTGDGAVTPPPVLAIKQRNGAYIFDRAGSYIELRD